MSKVLGQLKALPIEQVEVYIGEQIALLNKADPPRPNSLHMAMSIAEYLKDARRWAHVKEYIPNFHPATSPDEVQRSVDRAMERARKPL